MKLNIVAEHALPKDVISETVNSIIATKELGL